MHRLPSIAFIGLFVLLSVLPNVNKLRQNWGFSFLNSQCQGEGLVPRKNLVNAEGRKARRKGCRPERRVLQGFGFDGCS